MPIHMVITRQQKPNIKEYEIKEAVLALEVKLYNVVSSTSQEGGEQKSFIISVSSGMWHF